MTKIIIISQLVSSTTWMNTATLSHIYMIQSRLWCRVNWALVFIWHNNLPHLVQYNPWLNSSTIFFTLVLHIFACTNVWYFCGLAWKCKIKYQQTIKICNTYTMVNCTKQLSHRRTHCYHRSTGIAALPTFYKDRSPQKLAPAKWARQEICRKC